MRVTNDLQTSIRITEQEALMSSTKKLPIQDDDSKIEIVIQPNQIKTLGDTIRIQSQGWLVRNDPDVRDLLMHVEIMENKAKHKKRRKRTMDKTQFN
jgi:DnaJ-class molecular chaperone